MSELTGPYIKTQKDPLTREKDLRQGVCILHI